MTKLDSHHSHNLSEEVVTETVRRLLPSLYVHSPEWRPRRQWELEGLRPLRGRCSRSPGRAAFFFTLVLGGPEASG